MKAINEHFEVGQQYYALVSKEVLVVSDRKSVRVGKECRSRWSPYH